jgi:hypothetical protein
MNQTNIELNELPAQEAEAKNIMPKTLCTDIADAVKRETHKFYFARQSSYEWGPGVTWTATKYVVTVRSKMLGIPTKKLARVTVDNMGPDQKTVSMYATEYCPSGSHRFNVLQQIVEKVCNNDGYNLRA